MERRDVRDDDADAVLAEVVGEEADDPHGLAPVTEGVSDLLAQELAHVVAIQQRPPIDPIGPPRTGPDVRQGGSGERRLSRPREAEEPEHPGRHPAASPVRAAMSFRTSSGCRPTAISSES